MNEKVDYFGLAKLLDEMIMQTPLEFPVALWVIFQYDDIMKVAGVDMNTGRFRISSEISSIINHVGENNGCEIRTKTGSVYRLFGAPCNIVRHGKIFNAITKHAAERSTNFWSDVSYIGTDNPEVFP